MSLLWLQDSKVEDDDDNGSLSPVEDAQLEEVEFFVQQLQREQRQQRKGRLLLGARTKQKKKANPATIEWAHHKAVHSYEAVLQECLVEQAVQYTSELAELNAQLIQLTSDTNQANEQISRLQDQILHMRNKRIGYQQDFKATQEQILAQENKVEPTPNLEKEVNVPISPTDLLEQASKVLHTIEDQMHKQSKWEREFPLRLQHARHHVKWKYPEIASSPTWP